MLHELLVLDTKRSLVVMLKPYVCLLWDLFILCVQRVSCVPHDTELYRVSLCLTIKLDVASISGDSGLQDVCPNSPH
jgi:hypothetical protein